MPVFVVEYIRARYERAKIEVEAENSIKAFDKSSLRLDDLDIKWKDGGYRIWQKKATLKE